MSEAALEGFLAQTFPTPLGVIATLRRDGSPHVVPIWFRWDSGAVTIWTTETRVWVRDLLRDPRVAFSVQTFEELAANRDGRSPGTDRTASAH